MHHFAECGDGKYRVWADIVDAGNDLIVYIGGGEKPHIGGASFILGTGEPFSLSSIGHKDYLISSSASKKISAATGRNCLVVVGIHIDSALKEEIACMVANSERCVDKLILNLGKRLKLKNRTLQKASLYPTF